MKKIFTFIMAMIMMTMPVEAADFIDNYSADDGTYTSSEVLRDGKYVMITHVYEYKVDYTRTENGYLVNDLVSEHVYIRDIDAVPKCYTYWYESETETRSHEAVEYWYKTSFVGFGEDHFLKIVTEIEIY